MKYMMTYDLMESVRNTNQWLGASARAFASYPAMSLGANPAMDWLKAWGEVTERTFSRMVVKPDCGTMRVISLLAQVNSTSKITRFTSLIS